MHLNLCVRDSPVKSDMTDSEDNAKVTSSKGDADMTPRDRDVTMRSSIQVSDTSEDCYRFSYSDSLPPRIRKPPRAQVYGKMTEPSNMESGCKAKPKITRNATFDEIQHLLPETKFSPDAQKMEKCRFRDCRAVGFAATLGYCPAHLTKLYNDGVIELEKQTDGRREHILNRQYPEPQESTVRQRSQGLQPHTVRGGSPGLAFRGNSVVIHNARTVNFDGRNFGKPTKPQPSGRHNAPVGKHTKHNRRRRDPDIVESCESSDESADESNRGNQRMRTRSGLCASGICFNLGDKAYNGLCPECYNLLKDARFNMKPPPQPDYTVNCRGRCKGMSDCQRDSSYQHCQQCQFKRQCQHREQCQQCQQCQQCGAHVRGGCFCACCCHASRSVAASYALTAGFSKHSAPRSSARLLHAAGLPPHCAPQADTREPGPRDSLQSRDLHIRPRDSVQSPDCEEYGDLHSSSSETSYQPTDGSPEEYIVSIGDRNIPRKLLDTG